MIRLPQQSSIRELRFCQRAWRNFKPGYLEDLLSKVASEQIPEIPFIVKADTQGSAEAICDTLKNKSEKIKAKIIHKGVGGINSTDLSLAETTGSVLFGFNVRAARGLSDEAKSRFNCQIFHYCYELIDAAKAIMKGNLLLSRVKLF